MGRSHTRRRKPRIRVIGIILRFVEGRKKKYARRKQAMKDIYANHL